VHRLARALAASFDALLAADDPLYVVLFASLPWAIWAWGGVMDTGLGWWSLCWLLPLLMPLGSIGGKRWSDDARPSAAAGADRQRR